MANENNTIYTPEEEEILNLTKKVRVDIVNNMVKNGVPERSGDIRVLNEVSSSLDKLISDSANARIKHQDTANNKASAELIIAAIMSKKKDIPIQVNRKTEIDDVIDIEVVPGQMDINPAKLNPSDFIESDPDEDE